MTFLFTDIEGSTRRWETDADLMRTALVAHDEALRDAIESHGGFLFSHTEDGVVAAFASPRPAVDTAIAHLRDLVGDQIYESLACNGDTMSTAEMVAYAYAQIDEARAQLKAVAK